MRHSDHGAKCPLLGISCFEWYIWWYVSVRISFTSVGSKMTIMARKRICWWRQWTSRTRFDGPESIPSSRLSRFGHWSVRRWNVDRYEKSTVADNFREWSLIGKPFGRSRRIGNTRVDEECIAMPSTWSSWSHSIAKHSTRGHCTISSEIVDLFRTASASWPPRTPVCRAFLITRWYHAQTPVLPIIFD